MPAGRNTKGQNGQDHEPNVPGGGGLDARELPCSPVAGEVFFLDIPFYRAAGSSQEECGDTEPTPFISGGCSCSQRLPSSPLISSASAKRFPPPAVLWVLSS